MKDTHNFSQNKETPIPMISANVLKTVWDFIAWGRDLK